MITHVALKDATGKVWTLAKPNRHHNVIHDIHVQMGDPPAARKVVGYSIQGFTDQDGKFYDRAEGFLEALRCNQILPPKDPTNPSVRRGEPDLTPRELYSEDLW
jgi:hypothetical protein